MNVYCKRNAKILKFMFIILLIQLYCLAIVFKDPILGFEVKRSEDNKWYINHTQEGYWGEHLQLGNFTEVIKIDGVELSEKNTSAFKVIKANNLTIMHEGKLQTLEVSYDGIPTQFLKHFVMPLIYTLLTTAFCLYLLQRPLTKNKRDLIFHLQFISLAYISAGAAGRGDYLSNIVVSLTVFLSLVSCITYCNNYLKIMNDQIQKKLRVLFILITIVLIINNILRIFIKNFLFIQVAFELLVLLSLLFLLVFNIILALQNNSNKHAKSLFFIFILGLGPFMFFYGVPTLVMHKPFLSADMTALFLLIIPICFIYLELAERLISLPYAIDRMLSHLKLAIPFALVLSAILVWIAKIQSIDIFSLYFINVFIGFIILLSYKEWLEVKSDRYITTSEYYTLSNFYSFINTSKYNDVRKLIDRTKKELSLILKLHLDQIEILKVDLNYSKKHLESEAISANLIYKNNENYVFVLHETVDSKIVATVKNTGDKFPYQSLKILELFLYYIQNMIDNLLKMEELINQLTQLDSLRSPRWYNRLLISSSEKERIRLSAEIHDTILQDLIRVSRTIEESINLNHDVQMKGQFSHLREEVLDIIEDTRDICEYLYPPMIERLGINLSLEELFKKSKIRFNALILDELEQIKDVSLHQATAIYRIIQELLSNANKHSQAKVIQIKLKTKGRKIYIDYKDDGVGFNPQQINEFKTLGLIGIRERIKYYGGKFEMELNYPQGTIISIFMDGDEVFENNDFR